MADLTSKQKLVFDFLVARANGGLPPTVREICEGTGIKSTSTVFNILNVLENNGLISRSTGSSRGISIVGAAAHVNVPLVGVVTAGLPILATQNIEEYLPVSAQIARGRELFALRVKGMSMVNAGILDGDIVYAETSATASDGDIVVALIDDEATVKRLMHDRSGRVVLMPENEAFSPIIPDDVSILGKVVASFRQY